MLVVWMTYLQLIYLQFRSARQTRILITRAAGRHMRSRCLITNMSSQPVYVTSLIGTLHIGGRDIELALTDLQDLPGDLGNDPRSRMAQGSLNTGQYLDIGRFDTLVDLMLEANKETEIEVGDVECFDLAVVAFYGWEHLPVGATRRFHFVPDSGGGVKVQPLTAAAEQITRKSKRRELLRTVEQHM
ncbi:hypothetical protein LK12_01280 [Novosphingobium malaysiense]|uniref:Uncharacterized protein n=2 Tax=Novosphingobium malaysiense TaxID=1348853 RepID=A0A0B1ZW39_9SPHN|nr:hypothetical protein LK12_01280 [Novosphingobium malaysiense]